MKKESPKEILLLIQTVLATAVFSVGLGYIFEKSYLNLLEIFLSMLIFVIAYSNYKIYKLKFVTPICIIFGILLIIGVIM